MEGSTASENHMIVEVEKEEIDISLNAFMVQFSVPVDETSRQYRQGFLVDIPE